MRIHVNPMRHGPPLCTHTCSTHIHASWAPLCFPSSCMYHHAMYHHASWAPLCFLRLGPLLHIHIYKLQIHIYMCCTNERACSSNYATLMFFACSSHALRTRMLYELCNAHAVLFNAHHTGVCCTNKRARSPFPSTPVRPPPFPLPRLACRRAQALPLS